MLQDWQYVGLTTALSAAKGRASTVWLDPCVLRFEETSTTGYALVSIMLNNAVESSVLSNLLWYRERP